MDLLEPATFLPWTEISLPPKLPVFSLRLINRMPQLGVLLETEAIKSKQGTPIQFRSDGAKSAGDAGIYDMYKQMYEPTIPHAVETGVLFEVPLQCFMTMPEKGPRVYQVSFADNTKKQVALIPMIGPYGNERKYGCWPDVLKNAYMKGEKNVEWWDKDEIGVPDSSGYLSSFKPQGGGYITWDADTIDSWASQAASRDSSFGNYDNGPARLYKVFEEHSPKGLNCLVVGSAPNPWVEAILLEFGAKHVTTSEYQVPGLDLPKDHRFSGKMKTIHHEELLQNPIQFDMIVSFSSLEHDGLGRYHDPISPRADEQQMRNLFDMVKPGGLKVVEVPVGYDNREYQAGIQDGIEMNLHRVYGPLLYPKFTEVWKLEGLYGLHGKVGIGTEPGVGGFNKKESMLKVLELQHQRKFDMEPPVSVLRKTTDAKWTQDIH